MPTSPDRSATDVVIQSNLYAKSALVIVCEHASSFIPDEYDNLGLSVEHRKSHAAWDPGAMAVAQMMSQTLNAKLIAGGVSRLVYDCNRPPSAADAMPTQSELIRVPGNKGLSADDKAQRIATIYEPFKQAVAKAMMAKKTPVLVTIHSFTPIYHGVARRVEIGLLHDNDTRLADVMLAISAKHTKHAVQRNAPYGPEDGVTHTLRAHALPGQHPNIMIEIRNDLIATPEQQAEMAQTLSVWIADALTKLPLSEVTH